MPSLENLDRSWSNAKMTLISFGGCMYTEMARRTQENVLAEMLEKVLAYNIFQIIRLRKKLSEPEETERAAA